MNLKKPPHCYAIAALILTVFSSKVAANEDCLELARRAILGVNSSFLSMEPASHLALLRSQVLEALRTDCKDSAEAAYADLRMQELGAGVTVPVGILSPEQHQALLESATAYLQRFPASPPISTVFARTSHSVEAAQAAVRLNPHYQPAHAALAESLLLAGQLDKAQTALNRIPDLSVLSDGYTLQARILLARGELAGAILAARRSLHKQQTTSLLEPDGASALPISQANEVLGLAYLQRRMYKAAAQALIDARIGSERAEALLRDPPDGLQQALRARHFKAE